MRIFKAVVKNKQVFIANDNILVPDCVLFGNGADSNGFIISDDDRWYYIPLQADNWSELLEDVINALNQISTSVSSSLTTSPSSPISTTIQADLKPIIQKLETLKQNLV